MGPLGSCLTKRKQDVVKADLEQPPASGLTLQVAVAVTVEGGAEVKLVVKSIVEGKRIVKRETSSRVQPLVASLAAEATASACAARLYTARFLAAPADRQAAALSGARGALRAALRRPTTCPRAPSQPLRRRAGSARCRDGEGNPPEQLPRQSQGSGGSPPASPES